MMRILISTFLLIALVTAVRVAAADPQPKEWADFFPRELPQEALDQWQREAAKNPKSGVSFTRLDYARKTFWVVDWHIGDSVPYKQIAVYAPTKEGSYQRCLVADSNRAFSIRATVDEKTGMLELRERAASSLEGQVVLSCNLKTIGTPHSTGIVK